MTFTVGGDFHFKSVWYGFWDGQLWNRSFQSYSQITSHKDGYLSTQSFVQNPHSISKGIENNLPSGIAWIVNHKFDQYFNCQLELASLNQLYTFPIW